MPPCAPSLCPPAQRSPDTNHTSVKTGKVKDSTFRSFLDAYLGVGENIFAFCCGFAVSSSYFRKQLDD
jgi:hypothetical protein